MKLVVERGVPIPPIKHTVKHPSQKSETRLAIESLGIDECLRLGRRQKSVAPMVNTVQKEQGKRFTIRSTIDGCRIWRIE